MTTRRTGTRAKLITYLREYGPAGVPQIAYALHWDRVITMRAVAHGLEADVIQVHGNPRRGQRTYVVGTVKPQLQPKAEIARHEFEQSAVKIGREGSGIVAPISYRAQLCRNILAAHEADRAQVGPRKPGRGRPAA